MKLTRRKFIIGGIWATLGALLADAFWFERFFIETNEYFLKGVNSTTDNIKILQISDLHLREISSTMKNLAKKINLLKPDLICLTGDVIDDPQYLAVLDDFLKLIDFEIKKIAITGNWEYQGIVSRDELRVIYSKHNCEFLINENTQVLLKGKSISVIGINDFIGNTADFKAAIVGYQTADYTIVLNHCPEYRDIIAQQNKEIPIDLVLAGHTHGGQIALWGFAPIRPLGSGSYVRGFYTEAEPHMYVSKGVGTSVLPMRFGARAEIAVFHFKA